MANHTWSADFMADALWSGRRFHTFNVDDDFNRESMRIEIDSSLPSLRVIRALDGLVELRGAPRRLRLDNGPESISAAPKQWAQQQGVELVHIQPGMQPSGTCAFPDILRLPVYPAAMRPSA